MQKTELVIKYRLLSFLADFLWEKWRFLYFRLGVFGGGGSSGGVSGWCQKSEIGATYQDELGKSQANQEDRLID